MASIVGRILKAVVLRPRVRRLTWPQLVAGAAACRERFDALTAGETEETAAVVVDSEMSVADTLAHLAAANRSIAKRLDALRIGTAADSEPPDLFPGAGVRTLAEVRADYAESWNRLAEAAARPIEGPEALPHDFFGPMTAREWVALVAYHHEYHGRKLDRVKRSGAYRKAQGARW